MEISKAVSFFPSAPMLRDATIRIDPEFSPIQFPWARLTRLVFETAIPPRDFKNIIFQCKNLVSGSFAVDKCFRSDLSGTFVTSTAVVLSHLSSLKLQFGGDYGGFTGMERTLHGLALPSIQNFQLSASYKPIGFLSYPMIPALHTTAGINTGTGATSLTCLIIENIQFNVDHFAKMLHGCTALEKLALCLAFSSVEDILGALLPGDAMDTYLKGGPRPPSLPSLTTFVLVVKDKDSDTLPERLSALVHAWARDPTRFRPLEDITVYYFDSTRGWETKIAALMFDRLRKLLGPWREGSNRSLAVAESGMVLRTEVIREWFTLDRKLGWFEV
ncbi:hypothetical protein H0H81_001200 [Sphagnurus paluster]|uniref:Uncharacterized protein n=1 Tax=Sphagnurus paluster TaxID=117069 RepID=A0A9P7GH80_9AGAR|nr:hypothetical protein H0H81_001200 [Sphagnurus paluster]